MNKILFSSEKEDWETPQLFFEKYRQLYDIKMDVCASENNKKCDIFYSVSDNALTKDWNKNFWMNPPYGRDMYKWIKYAYEQHKKHNVTGVLLLPSRTDTKWFHHFILDTNATVEFIKGRLKFVGAKNSAPFPSIVVIFKN